MQTVKIVMKQLCKSHNNKNKPQKYFKIKLKIKKTLKKFYRINKI